MPALPLRFGVWEKKGKNFGVALDDYFKSQILTKLLFKKTVLKENYLLLKWLYGMEKPPSEALIKRVTSGRKFETYFLLIGLRKVELFPNSKKHIVLIKKAAYNRNME